MIEICPYTPAFADTWNAFNHAAINGHFLFDRRFMDYHADRFEDVSVVALLAGEPVAIVPANRAGSTVFSHQGLTFGGMVLKSARTPVVLRLFDACAARWRADGMTSLVYKPLPWIYPRAPASGDLYWLFQRNARLMGRAITTTIDYKYRIGMNARRARGVKRAVKEKLTFQSSEQWAAYWDMLSTVLQKRHGQKPVHALGEITLLAKQFPDAIRLFTAEQNSDLLAGVVMFVTPQVAHAQYIAASERGREVGALDGLFRFLIESYAETVRYFDFGISTEEDGRKLNEGLVTQKEDFGGTSVCHDIYELRL